MLSDIRNVMNKYEFDQLIWTSGVARGGGGHMGAGPLQVKSGAPISDTPTYQKRFLHFPT